MHAFHSCRPSLVPNSKGQIPVLSTMGRAEESRLTAQIKWCPPYPGSAVDISTPAVIHVFASCCRVRCLRKQRRRQESSALSLTPLEDITQSNVAAVFR